MVPVMEYLGGGKCSWEEMNDVDILDILDILDAVPRATACHAQVEAEVVVVLAVA